MSAVSPCPSETLVRDLVAGRLIESDSHSLREHLHDCRRCRSVLENLDTESMSQPTDDDPEHEATVIVEPTTLAQPPDGTIGDETTLDLSFLVPSSNPQALGKIGEYEVLGVLGEGGMGIVFKAFDESLHRVVAIKVLAPRLASSEKARRRFIREARAAAAINHPNVVTIHAVCNQSELPYLIMEYIAGWSLRQRIRSLPPLEPAEILRIAVQVANGLAAAHEHGVIHRDIKPANIMLEDGIERVKITDFGLALAAMQMSGITSVGQMVGTPAYMSPEQINGQPVDQRSDLFSLGCVMYAMVTGHSPFQGAHTLDVIRKVCDLHPVPLHEIDPTLPRSLSDLVDWLLEKDPNDRPQSSAEFAALLTHHLALANGSSSERMATLPVIRPARPRPPEPPRRWSRGLVAVAMVTLIGLALWFALSPRIPPDHPRAFLNRRDVTPPAPPMVKLVTVARTDAADVKTVGEALGRVLPGGTIRVLDDGTYRESIVIDDTERWRGLTLEAPRGATLTALEKGAALVIQDTPGVIVRGFRVRSTDGRSGITVEGVTTGVVLEDLTFEQSARASGSLRLRAESSAGAGESAGPAVTLRRSRFEAEAPSVCVWVQGPAGSGRPTGGLRIEGNEFHGPTVHLVLWGSVHEIAVTGNRFESSKNGINLNFESPGQARRVLIANNTFHDPTYWIGLVFTEARDQEITIANNLILGGLKIERSREEQIDEVADHWSFRANWWEPGPDSDDPSALQRVLVESRSEVSLKSRDPKSPEYLRPIADSSLATAGAGGDLPPFIGAFAPAEPKPK